MTDRTNSFHRHFERNTTGRDFVVGDIHGCFWMLEGALRQVGFDETKDRLFSVGDLIDRGPQSADVLTWLGKPWFHAVRGNHEQMLLDYYMGATPGAHYAANGGHWFIELGRHRQGRYVNAIHYLPVAITVDTDDGQIGIVHADVPTPMSWQDMIEALPTPDEYLLNAVLWSRSRVKSSSTTGPVPGIKRVFVGHTPLSEPVVLANVHHIDTGAFRLEGKLTLCDLAGNVVATAHNPPF